MLTEADLEPGAFSSRNLRSRFLKLTSWGDVALLCHLKGPTQTVARFVCLAALGSVPLLIAEGAQADKPDLSRIRRELEVRDLEKHQRAEALLEGQGCSAAPILPTVLHILTNPQAFSLKYVEDAVYLVGHIAETCKTNVFESTAQDALRAVPLLAMNTELSHAAKMREVAAFSLGRLDFILKNHDRGGSEPAVAALIHSVSDPEPAVQRAAVDALGRFQKSGLLLNRDDEAIKAIIQVLKGANQRAGGPDIQIQLASCEILQNFGSSARSARPLF